MLGELVCKREVSCILTNPASWCVVRVFYPIINRSRLLLLGVKKGKSPSYELAHKTHSARRKIHLFQEGHAG